LCVLQIAVTLCGPVVRLTRFYFGLFSPLLVITERDAVRL
jgi:hypothetical protein